MKPRIRWRRCETARDLDRWADAHRLVMPDDDLPAEHHARWIAVKGEEVAAFASAVLVDDGDAAFLSRAGVLPDFRGLGLQRAAVRVRERWARTEGARGCITYVMPTNVYSLRSLVLCGYVPYVPQRSWAGRKVLYLRRAWR